MKILLTGTSGFLGSRLKMHLEGCGHLCVAPRHSDFDITDEAGTMQFVDGEKPDAVIHCAAISDTGQCQRDPELSWRVNVIGTENLVKACKAAGARLIFMSSDQVYAGCTLDGALPESLEVQPSGTYGQHKLEAERRVMALMPDAIGLRLPWMYDFPERHPEFKTNRNIIVALRSAAEAGTPMKACTRELRGLSYVWDIIRNIEKALAIPGGIYNFSSENERTSYETYSAMAAMLGLPEALVVPDDSWTRNLSMDCSRLRQCGISFPETLEAFQRSLGE